MMINTITEIEEKTSTETLVTGPYVLFLQNDDYNTFDWVIECLIDVCEHTYEQASQCAYIVHYKGRCDVKYGGKDKMSTMKKTLIDRGLSASIESV